MKYPATRRAFVIGVVVVGLLFQAPTHADTSPALRVRHRSHNNLCSAAALSPPQQTDIHNTQESATSAQKMVRLPAAPQDIVPSIEVAASEGPSLIDCTKAPRAYTRILGLKFPIWKPSDGDNVDTGKGDIYGALMPPLEERWKVFQVSSGFVLPLRHRDISASRYRNLHPHCISICHHGGAINYCVYEGSQSRVLTVSRATSDHMTGRWATFLPSTLDLTTKASR